MYCTVQYGTGCTVSTKIQIDEIAKLLDFGELSQTTPTLSYLYYYGTVQYICTVCMWWMHTMRYRVNRGYGARPREAEYG